MNGIDCFKTNDGFNGVHTSVSFQSADSMNFCAANEPIQRWHGRSVL
jgi:hypothetical protein